MSESFLCTKITGLDIVGYSEKKWPICVVSTGQAGVPRAALDAALATRIRIGGWCPRGRKAEDGIIPSRYTLQEMESIALCQAVRRNARDTDGTLVLGHIKAGPSMAHSYSLHYDKPYLGIALADGIPPKTLFDWILEHEIRVLNIDGPCLSRDPDLYPRAATWLTSVFNEG